MEVVKMLQNISQVVSVSVEKLAVTDNVNVVHSRRDAIFNLL